MQRVLTLKAPLPPAVLPFLRGRVQFSSLGLEQIFLFNILHDAPVLTVTGRSSFSLILLVFRLFFEVRLSLIFLIIYEGVPEVGTGLEEIKVT